MNKLVDVLTYSFLVAGILVLTRPGSQGPKLVTAFGSSWAHIVQAASGQPVKG